MEIKNIRELAEYSSRLPLDEIDGDKILDLLNASPVEDLFILGSLAKDDKVDLYEIVHKDGLIKILETKVKSFEDLINLRGYYLDILGPSFIEKFVASQDLSSIPPVIMKHLGKEWIEDNILKGDYHEIEYLEGLSKKVYYNLNAKLLKNYIQRSLRTLQEASEGLDSDLRKSLIRRKILIEPNETLGLAISRNRGNFFEALTIGIFDPHALNSLWDRNISRGPEDSFEAYVKDNHSSGKDIINNLGYTKSDHHYYHLRDLDNNYDSHRVDHDIKKLPEIDDPDIILLVDILGDMGVKVSKGKRLNQGFIITLGNSRELKGLSWGPNEVLYGFGKGFGDYIFSVDLKKIDLLSKVEEIASLIHFISKRYSKGSVGNSLDLEDYLDEVSVNSRDSRIVIDGDKYFYKGLTYYPSYDHEVDDKVLSFIEYGFFQGKKLRAAKKMDLRSGLLFLASRN